MLNKIRGGMKVVGVRSPGFGDRKKQSLEDIAVVLTGAKVLVKILEKNLINVKLDNLGKAGRIIVSKIHNNSWWFW